MSRIIRVAQVDVFTRERFKGNPAGVVLDADVLSEPEMRAIAREMNLSETAFVFAPTAPAPTTPAPTTPDPTVTDVVPVRFFTPLREVPVCGHATLGAHFVRARDQGLGETGAVSQVSPGARWAIRWEPMDGATFLVMRQEPVESDPPLDEAICTSLRQALGLDKEQLRPGWPVQVVSTGHAKVMVPVASARVLEAIEPDLGALDALSDVIGVGGFFVFAEDDADLDTFTTCRMFAPALGINEDPVNGSGHGPLAAYLTMMGGADKDMALAGFWSRMGDHFGRGGRVWTQAVENGKAVEVGGFVTPVFSTTIELD